MEVKGWRYYNHAVVPTTAPHEKVDERLLKDGLIWKVSGGTPVLARWTTDYDCGYETNWWYTIIDKPLDISLLKSDYRRRIRLGLRNFTCLIIDVKQQASSMATITLKDWETYPEKYRPRNTYVELCNEYRKLSSIVWGAFDDKGELCAFQIIDDNGSYYSLNQGKSLPEKQKYQVNAALIASYLEYYADDIQKGKYISNGQRNIIHETNFNEDLCKKYGFRRVFCKLHIVYRFPLNIVVSLLYPFRKLIKKQGHFGTLVFGVLQMEKIKRSCQ